MSFARTRSHHLHHHHQNAWVAEAHSADLVHRECPRPTARSHSWHWQMEAAEPSPIWCSQVCLERLGGLLQTTACKLTKSYQFSPAHTRIPNQCRNCTSSYTPRLSHKLPAHVFCSLKHHLKTYLYDSIQLTSQSRDCQQQNAMYDRRVRNA